MAFLPELSAWGDGIYQLEETDVVQGGANGIDNLQAKQIANRLLWLLQNKQAADPILTALSELVTAADRLIYATGPDQFALAALTAFGRSLLDDADAAAARATLGLGNVATLNVGTAAGTAAAGDHSHAGYQASDQTLTALAALATAADRMIYATGPDQFGLAVLTAFGRSLLDDADAAAARATLGLGNVATLNVGTAAGTAAAGDHTHAGYQPAATAINTGNIAAQSVNYANSAGNANTVGGVSAANLEFSANKSLENVLASRASGVTYTNSTGKTIFVSVNRTMSANGTHQLIVNGATVGYASNGFGDRAINVNLNALVPPGGTYSTGGSGSLNYWTELR